MTTKVKATGNRVGQKVKVGSNPSQHAPKYADGPVTIAVPVVRSEVSDIDSALAWPFILGEEHD